MEKRCGLPSFFSMGRLREMVHAQDLEGASSYLNKCLLADPENPTLHLLNGFVYDEMAQVGYGDKAGLSTIAYRSAYGLDPSAWLPAYLLGLSELRAGNMDEAQRLLAEALVLRPNDGEILHALAYAAYYGKDIPLSISCIQKACTIAPKNPLFHRSAAVILAAGGQSGKAENHLKKYVRLTKMSSDHPDVQVAKRRIDDWEHCHRQAKKVTLAPSGDAEGLVSQQGASMGEEAAFQQKAGFYKSLPSNSKATVVIEVVIVRSSETAGSSKGNNIMKILSVALGGDGASIGSVGPAFAFVERELARGKDSSAGRLGNDSLVHGSWKKRFKYNVSPITGAYALNIANASDSSTEILVRPTVVTMVGRAASFIDGNQYVGATGGTSGAAIAAVDEGTKVEVTPTQITPDGKVLLDVSVSGSLFTRLPDTRKGVSEQVITSTRTRVSSLVKAFFGETIVIGGAYTQESLQEKEAFPLASSIPLLQYFFANDVTSSERKSILYLITPHRGGAVAQTEESLRKPLPQKSPILQDLKKRGLLCLGEFSGLYYILRYLSKAPLFADFRSGDIPPPFWGYENSNLNQKMDELSSFLFF